MRESIILTVLIILIETKTFGTKTGYTYDNGVWILKCAKPFSMNMLMDESGLLSW